jgi:phospholipase C
MQENRSFDTYFGTLRGVRGFNDPTAITLSTGRKVWYQPDAKNPDGFELPFHVDTVTTSAAASVDLSHHWDVQHLNQYVNSQDQNNPVVPASQTLPTQEPGSRPPTPHQ